LSIHFLLEFALFLSFIYSVSFVFFSFFFFYSCDHLDLHSFPTRRSSDLPRLRLFCLSVFHVHSDSKHGRCRSHPAHIDGKLGEIDRKSTRLNSSHVSISYAVFCLKKKKLQ